MLEPQPIFKSFQFVQEIAFKNKDVHRSDLGIERFGFIISTHVIERVHCEYTINFVMADTAQPVLEYSLRPLTEQEIKERLIYIQNHQDIYQDFIERLNNEPELKSYHLTTNEEFNSSLLFA